MKYTVKLYFAASVEVEVEGTDRQNAIENAREIVTNEQIHEAIQEWRDPWVIPTEIPECNCGELG